MNTTYFTRTNCCSTYWVVLLCLGVLCAAQSYVWGADFTWKGGGGSNFSTPANWINNTIPGTGDNLIFPLDPAVPPGMVRNDLPPGTAFNSLKLFSNGWTFVGNKLGFTGGITHATNNAGANTISSDITFGVATSSVAVSVINPASGSTRNQLLLNGIVDLGNAGMTYSGFGDLVINGTVTNVTGNGGIVCNGTGNVDITHANNFIGGTTINNGIVIADNVNALGLAAVTVNSATTSGTLQLGVNGVQNALRLSGFGFGGNGALTMTPGNGPITFWSNITLQANSSINVSSQTLILAGRNGNITGSIAQGPGASKSLTVVGTNSGILEMQDACSYTGVTSVLGATLLLDSPAAGQVGGTMTTSGYVVGLGGTLAVDNRTQLTNSRLSGSGTAFVELDGGILNFNVAVGGGTASNEQFGELDLGNSASGIIGANTVNLGSFNNTITVGTLKRYPGSIVVFAGTNLGSTNTIVFSALGSGAGLVPGAGNANGLLPFATLCAVSGDPSLAVAATDLATHGLNGNTGIGACASLVTSNTGFNRASVATYFGTGAENLKLNGDSGLDRDLYVNSLNLNGFTIQLNGYRLILSSGALFNGSATGSVITFVGHANPSFDGPKDQLEFATAGIVGIGNAANVPIPNSGFVPVEGIITTDQANITLNNVAITQSANLTINTSPATGSNKSFQITGTPHANGAFFYTGATWILSGNLGLGSTVPVIPSGTTVVIGDNRGTTLGDALNFQTNVQQLGTTLSPANVEINSTGQLYLGSGFSQTIGNLTLRSGLAVAKADLAGGTLTLAGNVTTRNVIASPSSNFASGTPGFPDLQDSGFASIDDNGMGFLILANNAGTTLDVDLTPYNASGDLAINAQIGGTSNVSKIGSGNVVISRSLSNGFSGNVLINGGKLTNNVIGYAKAVSAAGGAIGNNLGATFSSGLNFNGSNGSLNPGFPELAIAPASTGNGILNNAGQTSFSASSKVVLHLGNYGVPGIDYDQLITSTLNFGGAAYLILDVEGLGTDGVFSGTSGNAQSPLQWTSRTGTIPRFTNVPNETGVNILPTAHVINNPLGFVARVSYQSTSLTVDLRKPASRFLVTIPSAAVAGAPFDIVVMAVDDFGSPDPSYTGTVQFTSTDGQAVFPVDYTFVAGDAGVHTFSLGGTLKTVGNWTITATDTAIGFTGISAVTPTSVGPLALFVVASPPNATAGVPTSVTLTAYDAYGNIEFGYMGTVHFTSSSDIQLIPPPDTTLTNGSGTFTTTFNTAGVQTITAADTITTAAKGTSDGVLVVPAPVANFVVIGPSTVVAGHPAIFIVTGYDAFNNLTTNYTGNVHLTSSTDSGAKLPPDAKLTSGTGTFNVTFLTVGNQTATATDALFAIATGTSAPVSVTPAVIIISGPIVYPNPAIGNNSATVVADLPATFSVATSPENAIATWDFGVGLGTVTGNNPEFIYMASGTYTVTVTAKDIETGLTATKTLSVTVVDLEPGHNTYYLGTQPLKIQKGKIRLFPELLIFQCTIPNSTGANLVGSALSINFNGLNRTLGVVQRGKVYTRGGAVTFKAVNSKELRFAFAINAGDIKRDASTRVGLDANGRPKKALIDVKVGGIEGTFVTPLPYVTKNFPGLSKFGNN